MHASRGSRSTREHRVDETARRENRIHRIFLLTVFATSQIRSHGAAVRPALQRTASSTIDDLVTSCLSRLEDVRSVVGVALRRSENLVIQSVMNTLQRLSRVSDHELLHRLSDLVGRSRRIEIDLVAHIGEVDARRLYAREACPSMHAYCCQVLHLSEHEAFLRITVARAARRWPVLSTMLGDGRLHLTALAKIAPLLASSDADGRARLLRRATHATKRQIEELVAEVNPKPDVPPTIRKLPARKFETVEARPGELGPDRVDDVQTPDCDALKTSVSSGDSHVSPPQGAPAVTPGPMHVPQVLPAPRSAGRGEIRALAPSRHRVSFTASDSLREKLERLRALCRSNGTSDDDLAEIIEEAVTEKLERLEARKHGKAARPRKSVEDSDTSAGGRAIPAAVKRAVVARDDGRCTFVGDAGKRCTATAGLEFHHDRPFALGGDRSPENIRLLCRAHNAWFAAETFGRSAGGRSKAEQTVRADVETRPGLGPGTSTVACAAAPRAESGGPRGCRRTSRIAR